MEKRYFTKPKKSNQAIHGVNWDPRYVTRVSKAPTKTTKRQANNVFRNLTLCKFT